MRHLHPVIALVLGAVLAVLFLQAPATLQAPLEVALIVLTLAVVAVKLWTGTPHRHRLILSWLFLILIPGIAVGTIDARFSTRTVTTAGVTASTTLA